MPGFLGKWALGAPGCSASLGGAGSCFHLADREACLGESRGVIQVTCSQPDPVPSYPPSLRKLRRAGCPGEVTQLGSLAESVLIGPRSPVPQLPGFRGLRSLGDWAGPNHSWTPTYLGPKAWTTSILQLGLRGPIGHHWAAQPSIIPPSRGKGYFPRRASPPGVSRPLPAPPGNPAAAQMAGRFFLPRHPVRGRLGGPGCRLPHEPGLEPLGACPDVGPHPGWPRAACHCPMGPQGGLGGRKSVPCSPGS